MATGTEERWFVRADRDAPLKGPYTRAQIEQSHSKGILKSGALLEAEREGEGKHATVKDLVEEKEVARAKMLAEFREREAESEAARERSGGNGRMLLGVVMMLIGMGATAATCSVSSSAGGHYVVFTGLIVGGLVQIARGAGQR